MENIIDVVNGKVIDIQNIQCNDNNCIFYNNDPQIIFEFSAPIKILRITVELINVEKRIVNSKLYYKTNNDCVFTESDSYNYQRFLRNTIVDEFHFSSCVTQLRYDICDSNEKLLIKKITFEAINETESKSILIKNYMNNSNQKILLFSHDLSQTGAPILALNIAKTIKSQNIDITVLVGDTYNNKLDSIYYDESISLVYLNDYKYNLYCKHIIQIHENNFFNVDQYQKDIILNAKQIGYKSVVANTIVSGKYIQLFNKNNLYSITLIHEMKTTISNYGFYDYGKNIAKYSNIIVFPDLIVKSNFEELYGKCAQQTYIFPQGIYNNYSNNLLLNNEFDFINYNLPKINKYVLASGTAELRKGVDLFVNIAQIMHQNDEHLHFIWVGNFNENDKLDVWLKHQINNSNIKEHVHFLPFIKDKELYLKLLAHAKAFFLTSREDPFPSVALEAMCLGIPVIGFKNSGGFNTMAKHNKAIAIPNFNVNEFANESIKLIYQNDILDNAEIKKFISKLDFQKYVLFLVELSLYK